MYFNGQGVLQDYALAHMWFNLSSSNGFSFAVRNRNRDENSDLYKAMNKAGAKYLSEGPGKRAFIIKEWNQGLN